MAISVPHFFYEKVMSLWVWWGWCLISMSTAWKASELCAHLPSRRRFIDEVCVWPISIKHFTACNQLLAPGNRLRLIFGEDAHRKFDEASEELMRRICRMPISSIWRARWDQANRNLSRREYEDICRYDAANTAARGARRAGASLQKSSPARPR